MINLQGKAENVGKRNKDLINNFKREWQQFVLPGGME
jgi:hypothetical protein